MRRRLFNALTLLSLLLFIAVVVAWPFSHRTGFYARQVWVAKDSDGAKTTWVRCSVGVNLGRVVLKTQLRAPYPVATRRAWDWGTGDPAHSWFYGDHTSHASAHRRIWTGGGVRYEAYPRSGRYLFLPCSYLALLASLAPATWLLSWRRRRRSAVRARVGSCSRCGYDLRATPGRCPECGTAVPARQTAISS